MSALRNRRTRSSSPGRGAKAPRRGGVGFTLIELLVVILIIMTLLAMSLPTVARIRTRIIENNSRSIVNLIHSACVQYHEQLGDYPVDLGHLVQDLTGYRGKGEWNEQDSKFDDGDGQDGFGLRLRPRGQVFGPFSGTDKLRWQQRDDLEVFIDAFDWSILYSRYTDEGWQPLTDYGGPEDLDAYLKNTEGEYFRTDFAVISPGADGKYENFCTDGQWTVSDDITNLLNE